MSFEFFVRRYGHSKTASLAACRASKGLLGGIFGALCSVLLCAAPCCSGLASSPK